MSGLGRLAAAALGLALVAGTGGGSLAGAAPETAPRLTGKDLPTTAEMAQVYPDLAGGRRDVYRTRTFDANAAPDCVGIRALGRPEQALWASYVTADGDDPYFSGGEAASPFVHQFATRRAARRTVARLASYLARCEGAHRADATIAKLRVLDAPDLGQRTLAFQIFFRYLDPSAGDTVRRELHVVVLRGRRVVDAYLQAEKFVPSLDNGVRVAELTLAAR